MFSPTFVQIKDKGALGLSRTAIDSLRMCMTALPAAGSPSLVRSALNFVELVPAGKTKA